MMCDEGGHGKGSKICWSRCSPSGVVGLRILTSPISHLNGESSCSTDVFVHDSATCRVKKLIKVKPIFHMNPTTHQYSAPRSHHASSTNCFLNSCFLCNKDLLLDKEVYMYRGDQGFCSIECRERQIYLDDLRDLESSTKKMAASFRHCRGDIRRRETAILLEEFRQRRKPVASSNCTKGRVIFSLAA